MDSVTAVPSLVLDGNKRNITSLYIRIIEVAENEKEKLLTSISKILYFNKAVLGKSSEGTFLALFNVSCRQPNHELVAVKTALAIQDATKNIKSLKLGFGINKGKAIVSDVENGVINYTCLGNLVNIAKKLSFKSKDNVLFTQELYDKISPNLRANEMSEFFSDFNMKIYSLSRIIDRERYDAYVRDFMHRMKI